MLRDMMANFELYQPTAIDHALNLMNRYGNDGWVLAGGQDSFDWFKDRAKKPKAVIDINGIDDLHGIREQPMGLDRCADHLTECLRYQKKYGVWPMLRGMLHARNSNVERLGAMSAKIRVLVLRSLDFICGSNTVMPIPRGN